jgi:hypothetical protein
MRRTLFIAGLVLGLLLLAALGASISFVRNTLSLPFERSTTA